MPPFVLPGGTARLPEHVVSGGASNVSTRIAHSRQQRQQPSGRAQSVHRGDAQPRLGPITQASAVAVEAEPRISSLLSLNVDGFDAQAAALALHSPAFLPPHLVVAGHNALLTSPGHSELLNSFAPAASIFSSLSHSNNSSLSHSNNVVSNSHATSSRSAAAPRPRVVTNARKAQGPCSNSSSTAVQAPAAGPGPSITNSSNGTAIITRPSTASAPVAPTSSSSSSSSSSLPAALQRLTDASAPVQLPAARSIAPGSLDNRELDKLVATLGRSKATWRRALTLYEWLQDIGHTLDDRLATSLIRVCAEHGQAMAALGVYEWMRAPAGAGGAGLSPSVYTYTAAMRAALAAGLLQRALGVWEDARAANVLPDCRLAITYIELCSRMGNVDGALEMYGAMRSAQPGSRLSPTVHAYTAAMRAATEGGKWTKALEIWTDLRAAGVSPTGHAFAAAISACASGPDWQRAVVLFEEMCGDGIRPDVVSCTALVTALAAAGQWQRCEAVVKWMLDVGLKPNVRTFTALLTGLGNAQQWDRAVAMLGLMQTPEWGCVAPNAYTYSALLKALGEHGQWVLAERVFSELEAAAVVTATAGSSSSGVASSSGRSSDDSSSSGHGLALPMHAAASAKAAAAASAKAAAAAAAPEAAGSAAPGSPLHMASDTPLESWLAPAWQPTPGGITIQPPLGQPGHASGNGPFSTGSAFSGDVFAGSSAYDAGAFAGTSGSSAFGSDTWSFGQQWQSSNNGSSSGAASIVAPGTASGSSSGRSSGVNVHTSSNASNGSNGIASGSSSVLGSSWTSPSQLNGLDLELQHAAASSAGSSSSHPFNGAAVTAQALSAVPHTQQQQQQQQQMQMLQLNSDMVAAQLASMALSAQVAAALNRTNPQHTAHTATPTLTPSTAAPAPVSYAAASSSNNSSGSSRAPPLVNEVVCGALMMAYERAGKWQDALGVLSRARALGIQPNTVMLNIAISAAGKAGQLGAAEALFAQVPRPDAITYETLIAAYGMAGEAGKAEGLFGAMVVAGFRPRDYAYCGLIAAHSLSGDANAALRVRARMRRDNASPSIHVYNALIAACERARLLERALELLRTLKREGLEPNGVTLQLMGSIGQKGVESVEGQQLTAAALSAAVAGAATLLMRTGVF